MLVQSHTFLLDVDPKEYGIISESNKNKWNLKYLNRIFLIEII